MRQQIDADFFAKKNQAQEERLRAERDREQPTASTAEDLPKTESVPEPASMDPNDFIIAQVRAAALEHTQAGHAHDEAEERLFTAVENRKKWNTIMEELGLELHEPEPAEEEEDEEDTTGGPEPADADIVSDDDTIPDLVPLSDDEVDALILADVMQAPLSTEES